MMPVTHLNLEITNLCNQRCSYCFNGSGPFGGRHEVDVETWRNFLFRQKTQGLKSIHVTGGEPFVSEKALELLRLARDLGLGASVLSNGYRIPNLLRSHGAIFRRLSVVQISLDSGEAAVHDARRGKAGAWRQAVAAIRALRRANIPCEISCTVSQETLDEVKRLAQFCARSGLGFIARPLVSAGRGATARLVPVDHAAFDASVADIHRAWPGVLTQDRFQYVPDRPESDAIARASGIATVLPNGRFRGGRARFSQSDLEFESVSEFLNAA